MTRRSLISKIRKGIVKDTKSALQQLIEREFPFAVMHQCENIALFLKRPPEEGRPIEPEDVILPNGDKVELFGSVNCWKCGEPLTAETFAPENIRRVQ